MAAGEFVSVSSQADTEKADMERERRELRANPEWERQELAGIYVDRGLESSLADQVAEQLMARDPLAAHARDELGLSEVHAARPWQAAMASCGTFAVGASLPFVTVLIAPPSLLMSAVAVSSLFFLAVLGCLAAYVGGANVVVSATRVTFWGALAMALTAVVGGLFGTVI